MQRSILFVPAKRRYVRGDRPKVECILCSLRKKDPKVESLIVARDKHVFITLNLFPYNPGHLMIVPNRHVMDPRQFSAAEAKAVEAWTNRLLDALDKLYQPMGYNVGYNIGTTSGASIEHLHLHIVPRFKNEIGFIDVIGGARVHVEDPRASLTMLAEELSKKKRSTKRTMR